MEHLPGGYWNEGIRRTRPRLERSIRSDFLVIGGGLSGLWAALDVKRLRPDWEVVLLEEQLLGFGPSGRNGGIMYDYWLSLPRLGAALGRARARAIARLSEELLEEIEFMPDIEFRRGGAMHLSTNPYQDERSESVCRELLAAGRSDLFSRLSGEEARERICSPLWRGGTLYPRVATLHPAKLVQALAQRATAEGVRIYERSGVLELQKSSREWRASLLGGSARSPRVLLATGSLGTLRPLDTITSSSHMIITEPLVGIEEFWPGDEAATDERATVRYFRKTADGRVAFGWGRGRSDPHQSLLSRDEAEAEAAANAFRRFFPMWADRKIEYFWGGPIDISPTHLPLPRKRDEGLWSVAGYTGGGVGGSRVAAHMLAREITEGKRVSFPRPLLPLPPEPLLSFSGNIVRRALLAKEAAEERGEKPRLGARAVAALPGKLGIELGR